MLIGLKLNPTHLSLPVWFVRIHLPPPPRPCSQDRWHRGQKSGPGAPPVPIYRHKIRWPRRVVDVESRKSDSWNRGAEFLAGRGHSHRARGGRGLYVGIEIVLVVVHALANGRAF